jgi:hypothetical protein
MTCASERGFRLSLNGPKRHEAGANLDAPARSDLDPADIPALLPYMMLVEKVDDHFRWRLVGTAAVREIGRDLTGSIAMRRGMKRIEPI